jgi:ankyrin repeat protein
MLLAEGLSMEDEEPALNCEPPLLAASEVGEASAVEFLLRRGADPNHRASDGQTPLMVAVIARNLSVVRSLLAHGADPRAVIHRESGWTRDVTGIALDVGDTAIIRVIANAIPHSASPSGGN